MTYFGGKAQEGVYQTIINQIPPHRVYVEPFLGGGAVMLHKRPARRNVGIDLDGEALTRFDRQACLEDLEVLQMDALEFLSARIGNSAFDRGGTFIYCDPPYLHSTRSCERCRYKYEMSDSQHVELLAILKSLSCMVMISTYPNQTYADVLKDWRVIGYMSVARSGEPRTELLYMNYPEPEILHDDRYIGTDANNRQDINRRIARTKSRILQWPKIERLKMLRKLLVSMPTDELEYLRCSIGTNACVSGKKAKTPRYPEGKNAYRIRKKAVKAPIQADIGKSTCAGSDGRNT